MGRSKIWLFAVVVFTSVVWGQACKQDEGVRFGPVIEEVLLSDSEEKPAIDFDRGTLWDWTKTDDEEEFLGWFESTGVDAAAWISPEVRGLCGFDMVAFPVEQEKWEMSATEAVEAMSYGKVGSPIAISGKCELPATYMIRTREGGVGILQITGFSDEPNKPREVKFRYKMVKLGDVNQKDYNATLQRIAKSKGQLESAKKLLRLGKMLFLYASDNEEEYPEHLSEVRNMLGGEEYEWLIRNIKYLGKGKRLADHPDTVIAYDKSLMEKGDGTNVLYNTVIVTFERPVKLKELRIGGDVEAEVEAAEGKVEGEIETGEQITVRIVDSAGRGVSGAKVYTHFHAGDERRPSERGISDNQGKVVLDCDDIFRYAGRSKKALLYGVLGKESAGFVEVRGNEAGKEVGMRLEDACRVYGRLESSSLKELNQDLEWTNVYVYCEGYRPLSYSSKKGEFEFLLPPGRYDLNGYGTSTYHTMHEIEVKAGQEELEVNLDLPADRLANLVGKEAPEFRKIKGWINTGWMGRGLKLSKLRGKVVLLDFWGHWCGPCIGSMPKLMELHEKYKRRGLVIIAVHDDSIGSVEKLEKELEKISKERWDGREIEFAVALDGGGRVEIEGTERTARGATTAAYGIQAWPTMVLIDKEGRVAGRFYPRNDEDMKRLEGMLGS